MRHDASAKSTLDSERVVRKASGSRKQGILPSTQPHRAKDKLAIILATILNLIFDLGLRERTNTVVNWYRMPVEYKIIHLMHYSFADSLRVPTFNLSWYFLRTDSLWYCVSLLATIFSNEKFRCTLCRRQQCVGKAAVGIVETIRSLRCLPLNDAVMLGRHRSIWCPRHTRPAVQSMYSYSLTFQNCLLASFPPTLFKIFAPPGCSSTKLPIAYTSLSMIMCRPFSTLPASFTSLAVNSFDMVGGFGRGMRSNLDGLVCWYALSVCVCINLVFGLSLPGPVCDCRCYIGIAEDDDDLEGMLIEMR